MAIYHESLKSIIASENCEDAIKDLSRIQNTKVRDNAIRMALPVLMFRKENIDTLPDIISAGSLKEVATCLVNGETEGIFTESVSCENGLEIHDFSINKKLVYEEEWLTKQIAVLFLFERRIRNIYSAMEEIQKENRTWITDLLIADRKIEKYIGEVASEDNNAGLSELLVTLQQNTCIY